MSNYIKSTDFASKDSLTTGDPLKIVSGTEIDDEFNAIQTAVNTKANTNSPTLTGTPAAPTASAGTNTTQIATTAFVTSADTTLQTTLTAAIQALYPVGSVYMNATNNTNPATLFGFGTWVAFGAGRVPVGFDSSNNLFNTAEETGGSYDAVLVEHTHTVGTDSSLDGSFDTETSAYNGSGSFTTDSGVVDDRAAANNEGSVKHSVTLDGSHSHTLTTEGESGTNANVQPYITVYMWKRTA